MLYLFGDNVTTYVTTDGQNFDSYDADGKFLLEIYEQNRFQTQKQVTCQNSA